MTSINYSYNFLTELPPLSFYLKELSCHDNCLTRLPEHLPDSLTELYCYNNRLTKLPEHLPNSLTHLYCSYNRLTKLPEHLPNSLTHLYCGNNRLTKLPEQLPNSLTSLDCYNNYLIKLPMHKIKYLYYVNGSPFVFNIHNNTYNFKSKSYTYYKILNKILILQSAIKKYDSHIFHRDLNRLCNMY